MTGVGEGIGAAILITLILLVYIPLVTLLALIEIGLFKNLTNTTRTLALIGYFAGLTLLTLLTIRSFPYVSLDWLTLYAISLTLILAIQIYIRKKRRTEKR